MCGVYEKAGVWRKGVASRERERGGRKRCGGKGMQGAVLIQRHTQAC